MTRYELADAMLRGLHTKGVEESRQHYVTVHDSKNICFVCAIGAALVGEFNGDFREAEIAFDNKQLAEGMGEYDAASELLDISPALAVEIEHKHLNGMPIQQIAAWLKGGE